MRYTVCYEIVTEESARDGDCAESGIEIETNDLREALDFVTSTRTCEVGGVEACEWSSYPHITEHDWLTIYNGSEFRTGDRESRTLHFRNTTVSSMRRIGRLLGVWEG